MTRQCGSCTLCCRLLPVNDHGKPAITRCQHQRIGRGCAIYEKRPGSCRTWSCAWLIDPETRDLSRPDRSRYVIDIVPEFVTLRDDASGEEVRKIPVLQIWLNPAAPDAWKDDQALLAYLARRGEQGLAALMRSGSHEAFAVFRPTMAEDREWHVMAGGRAEIHHTAGDVAKVLSDAGVSIAYEVAL